MYGLYSWLIVKGQVAYLNKYPSKDYIAIYPEITHGDPMNAGKGNVVRYLLNKPGFMPSFGVTGPTTFDESDKIFVFSRIFQDAPEDHILFLPILNMHVFKDQGKKRTKRCIFYGKAISKDSPLPKDYKGTVVTISRKDCQDQQALADLLNECEVIYIYDQVTAMTEIARLCGCRVVLFHFGVTEEDYKKYEPGLNGVSLGGDRMIPLDAEGFRSHYLSLRQIFSRKIDHFIEMTQ
jgi:hypothetical protein